jgi:hypothetical protein
MKKSVKMLLLQGLFLLTFTCAKAQQITDVNLKNAILRSCPTCLDNNGNLLSAARTVTVLDLGLPPNISIRTSKGLEGFISLTSFNLNGDLIATHKLDSFPPNLLVLGLVGGNFEKINKLPSNLNGFLCFGFGLYIDSILPPLPKHLEILHLSANNIVALPRLPDSLILLIVSSESLKLLPALPKTLKGLELTSFVQPNKQLTTLPVLPPNITSVTVYGFERLVNIPNLPNSITQLTLNRDSLLERLPSALPSRLSILSITSTALKCLPILPNSIKELNANNITCIPNVPTSLNTVRLSLGGVNIDKLSDVIVCNRVNSTCQYPASISGKIYYDGNNNGFKDTNELDGKSILIQSTNGSLVGLTDTIGNYFLNGDSLKTYTFSPFFPNNYFKIIPSSRTITTTSAIAQRFDNLDFAIQSNGTFPDIALSITSGEARPGFNSVSTLTYKNVGTTVLNGTITLALDAKQTFISADVPPTSQNGNILTWNYTNLQLFDFKNINITLKTALTAPLSSLAISTVNGTITGASDANPLNNSETTQITVRGSYDPNDKQVDKTAIKTITSIATTPLTYTIRFQNTGNADAIRVEVVDSLPKKLDITSIEMLGASHPYELKIVSDSGKVKDFTVVKWTFDGIYLPDSTTNEKGSHGFIKFRIKNDTKKMGLTVDSIFNKAAIYFDFNPPIITNQARTLFSPRVATVELKDLGLNVFPNPVSNVLTINSTNKIEQELTIDVVNLNGQVLMHQILSGQNPQINVQELSAGLYFLKIKTSEGIGIVKIVKE